MVLCALFQVFSLLVVGPARAAWPEEAAARLDRIGFEWISTESESGHARVTFENRVDRYEMTALGEAAGAAVIGLPDDTILTLVPLNRGVPILALTARAGDWAAFLSGGMTDRDFRSRLRIEPGGGDPWPGSSRARAGGTSLRKFDVGVRPLAEVRLGIADNPFEGGFWLAPEMTTSPVRGVLVTGQAIVELHDEFDPYARKVSPGRNTLSVWSRLPGNALGVISGGYFPGNRYGFAWEAGRFLAGGRLELRVAGDYSGFLKFSTGGRVLYSDMKAWSGLGSAIVRTPGIDLEVNATGGRFIHGDRGARVDVLRRFGETEFGFFVTRTNEGSVGGFRFSVPLPVRRQLRPSRVRPITVPAFPFEYREDQAQTGRRVRMFDTLDRIRKGLTPEFVLNNLEALRPGATGGHRP